MSVPGCSAASSLQLTSMMLLCIVGTHGMEDSRKRSYDDVRTLMGGEAGLVDGYAADARFDSPAGLALGPDGTFLLADSGNHAIRMLQPTGFLREYQDKRKAYRSCAEIRVSDPRVADGPNLIYYEGNLRKPIEIYCHDMAGDPRDYIEVDPLNNYASYTCAGLSTSGFDLVTRFSKLRYNSSASRIVVDDWTFANSTGNCTYNVHGIPNAKAYTSTNPNDCATHGGICGRRLRYGFAGSCRGGGDTSGHGMIDLRNTTWAIHKNTTWRSIGFLPGSLMTDVTNNVTWSGNQTIPTNISKRFTIDETTGHFDTNYTWYVPTQVVRVGGGGSCGWVHTQDLEYEHYLPTSTHQCAGSCTGFGPIPEVSDNQGLRLEYLESDISAKYIHTPEPHKDYNVTTLAGKKNRFGTQDGVGVNARFRNPTGIVFDVNMWHSSTAYIYVADQSNHAIRRMTVGGVVDLYAGQVGNSQQLCKPHSITVAANGNLYWTEFCNHVLRAMTPGGVQSEVAGSLGLEGSIDGVGGAARFNGPCGLALQGTIAFIAEAHNNLIRKVDLATGAVSTLAGQVGVSAYSSGIGTSATFQKPVGLLYNPTTSELYVSEIGRIRTIALAASTHTPYLQVNLVAGPLGPDTDGTQIGVDDGVNVNATFGRPSGMALLNNIIYVNDYDEHRIRMIQDRSCPFGAYSICNTNVTAKYMRSSTPMPACNHTEWQFLKAAGQLATVGNVSDACNVQLNKYCKVNGNFDKACQIVPKHCPAHTNGLPCSGHGNCNQLTAICTCDSAWYLDDCSNSTCPVSDFGDTDCNPPHGSCNKRIPVCECAPGRYGTTCEFSTCPGNCSGHGSCVARTGQCVCNYPWSGAACDHWQWYVTPVVKHHSDQEYDMFDLDLRWWNITRWEYYTIEVNTNLTDTLSNQQFTITLMKERLGVYATEQYWDGKSYPTDHAFHRSISICPLDIATVDPRYNWKIGVKALPNTPYQLQFNVTKTLIPLDEDFIVETYGYRYLHIDHLPQHQANYTYMWLDIEILEGGFNSISVRSDTCPLEEHENSHLLKPKDWTRSTIFDTWGYIDTHTSSTAHTSSTVSNYTSGNSSSNSSTQTGREYNSTYAPSTQTNRYRLELWSCGAPTGTYFVAIDARGKYVKAKLRATIGVNDHRCQTIVPPMREEILVTFGEVVERSFPIVIGFVVFVFLLFLAVRYCIKQAAVSAAHRKRIDMERYKKISSTEYFGEDEPTEEEYSTKTLRKAKSAFQTRREREKRIEKEIVKAQMLVDGYDNDNSNEATY